MSEWPENGFSIWAEVDQSQAYFDACLLLDLIWTDFDQLWPDLTEFGQIMARVGELWANPSQLWPISVNFRRFRSKFVDFGHIWRC